MYDYHNGASIYLHIAFKTLTRGFLRAMFRYPFVQLNCQVMIGLIAGDNPASMRFAKKVGGTLVHTIAHGHPSGDLHIYTMYRDQCRWLE